MMEQKQYELAAQVLREVQKVILGKREIVEKVLMAVLAQGHVLLDDVPGVGKTTLAMAFALAKAFSKTLGLDSKRVQFTSDTLPSDIIGFSVFDKADGKLKYQPGAIMTNLLLADEINRTSTKTQAALLEAMEERRVTVDGKTHPLPQPFFVLATQNPGEFVGTYPLPEAQMDRFFLRLSIGYPTIEQEMDVLERYSGVVKPMATLSPVCPAADVIAMQEMVTQIYCSPEVRSYVATIAAATRQDAALQLGASTRAAIALIHGARIKLESQVDVGTTITVTFPTAS